MPILRRNAKPLLRQVNNKPHASSDDHHENTAATAKEASVKGAGVLPTPPLSGKNAKNGNGNGTGNGSKNAQNKENEEGDIFADPMSSSDDEEGAEPVQRVSGSLKENGNGNRNIHAVPPPSKLGFKQARGFNAPNDAKSGFRPPPGMASQQSGGSGTSKRSASEDHGGDDDEGANSDDMVFSSQASSQQRKKTRVAGNGTGTGRKPVVGNIHAPPTGGRVAMRYGKRKVLTAKDRKEKKTNAAGFKTPKGLQAASEKAKSPPKFKFAKGADVFTFGQGEDEAQNLEASENDPSELSELSSAESEVEEIDPQTLNLPAPKKYTPTADCGVCGARVPLQLKQEFEIRYSLGKALTYKWQQRFCRFHKVEAAKIVWVERGYPSIEWNKLDERLREHHGRLVAVLAGKKASPYRARLQKVLDSGTTRTAMKAFNAATGTTSTSAEGQETNLEIKPGYYGPRGEKLMTEHILSHFSARLRELALTDPLIKASGVAGGVSGFVQAVLVPELAVALVEGDLTVDASRASRVLAESLEVGELLNEEVDERVERDGEVEGG